MAFVLRLTGDRDVPLGPTIELLRAFKDMAALDPGDRYPALYGVTQTNEEILDDAYVREVARQARAFRRAHGRSLSTQARWVLEQLEAM